MATAVTLDAKPPVGLTSLARPTRSVMPRRSEISDLQPRMVTMSLASSSSRPSTALPSQYDIYGSAGTASSLLKKRSRSAGADRPTKHKKKEDSTPVSITPMDVQEVQDQLKPPTSVEGVFAGIEIVMEFTSSTPYKEKKELKKMVTSYGGILSYILTKKTRFVVVSCAEAATSYKCREGVKRGVPVVSQAFLQACVDSGSLANPEDFLMAGAKLQDQLAKGTITVSAASKTASTARQRRHVDMSKIKFWKESDGSIPLFSKEFSVVKWAFYEMATPSGVKSPSYIVVEVDAAKCANEPNSFRIKQFHQDSTDDVSAFTMSGPEAEQIFAHLCTNLDRNKKCSKKDAIPPGALGSSQLNRMLWRWSSERNVSESVAVLVNVLWGCAVGELRSVLGPSYKSLSLSDVEKADGILLQLARDISAGKEQESALADQFYEAVPHTRRYRAPIKTMADVTKKQNTCQLLKDMLSVSEVNSKECLGSARSKLQALKCCITDADYTDLLDEKFTQAGYHVVNVFGVSQSPADESSHVGGQETTQLLFHASSAENFVGILSRGLLLPKVAVEKYGVIRTDAGKLGAGIYFADDVRTASGYSSPCPSSHVRFMVACRVALGRSKVIHKQDPSLTTPPEGYDSLQGQPGESSDFESNEYAIYSVDQYQLAYIIMYTTPEDPQHCLPLPNLEEGASGDKDLLDQDAAVDISDVSGIKNPLDGLKAGLVGADDKAVPLTSVHVRAKLIDLASEVAIYQTYVNKSMSSIEGKFVFPLSEAAAVCAFEVYINKKHVIGVVKEKEKARKEYREAVAAGHGAFLLDQDKERPDIFTVSLGNVPARAVVKVKLVYVAELLVEGDRILFDLPASLTPEKKEENLRDTTQRTTDSVAVRHGRAMDCSVKVSIEMPYDLRDITSPTHSLRVKRSLTKAQLELRPGQNLYSGFQLRFSLAEIHVPRMWVEASEDPSKPAACMLTFYPEFELPDGSSTQHQVEVILMLDCSSSMQPSVKELRKASLLCLSCLPDGTLFNVVKFGSGYEELFVVSRTKSNRSEALAKAFITSATANMGATELIEPVENLALLSATSGANGPSLSRNIFVFSDGNISDRRQLLSATAALCPPTRLFTFGVGKFCNNNMMRQLANRSAGHCEILNAKTKSKWEGQIKSQIERAGQPALTSVSVDWQTFGEGGEGDLLRQAPSHISAVFNGTRLVVYGLVDNCTQATLRATIGGTSVSTVVSTRQLDVIKGHTLHRLAARALTQDWEGGLLTSSGDGSEQEMLKVASKAKVIELSVTYSIVTSLTSFVAIEKRGQESESPAVNDPFDIDKGVDCLPSVSWDDEHTRDADSDGRGQLRGLFANSSDRTRSIRAAKCLIRRKSCLPQSESYSSASQNVSQSQMQQLAPMSNSGQMQHVTHSINSSRMQPMGAMTTRFHRIKQGQAPSDSAGPPPGMPPMLSLPSGGSGTRQRDASGYPGLMRMKKRTTAASTPPAESRKEFIELDQDQEEPRNLVQLEDEPPAVGQQAIPEGASPACDTLLSRDASSSVEGVFRSERGPLLRGLRSFSSKVCASMPARIGRSDAAAPARLSRGAARGMRTALVSSEQQVQGGSRQPPASGPPSPRGLLPTSGPPSSSWSPPPSGLPPPLGPPSPSWSTPLELDSFSFSECGALCDMAETAPSVVAGSCRDKPRQVSESVRSARRMILSSYGATPATLHVAKQSETSDERLRTASASSASELGGPMMFGALPAGAPQLESITPEGGPEKGALTPSLPIPRSRSTLRQSARQSKTSDRESSREDICEELLEGSDEDILEELFGEDIYDEEEEANLGCPANLGAAISSEALPAKALSSPTGIPKQPKAFGFGAPWEFGVGGPLSTSYELRPTMRERTDEPIAAQVMCTTEARWAPPPPSGPFGARLPPLSGPLGGRLPPPSELFGGRLPPPSELFGAVGAASPSSLSFGARPPPTLGPAMKVDSAPPPPPPPPPPVLFGARASASVTAMEVDSAPPAAAPRPPLPPRSENLAIPPGRANTGGRVKLVKIDQLRRCGSRPRRAGTPGPVPEMCSKDSESNDDSEQSDGFEKEEMDRDTSLPHQEEPLLYVYRGVNLEGLESRDSLHASCYSGSHDPAAHKYKKLIKFALQSLARYYLQRASCGSQNDESFRKLFEDILMVHTRPLVNRLRRYLDHTIRSTYGPSIYDEVALAAYFVVAFTYIQERLEKNSQEPDHAPQLYLWLQQAAPALKPYVSSKPKSVEELYAIKDLIDNEESIASSEFYSSSLDSDSTSDSDDSTSDSDDSGQILPLRPSGQPKSRGSLQTPQRPSLRRISGSAVAGGPSAQAPGWSSGEGLLEPLLCLSLYNVWGFVYNRACDYGKRSI